MKQKWLFVINPKSGSKRRADLAALIANTFGPDDFYELLAWEDPHKFEVIEEAIFSGKYTTVVAAGGDGTVNRVGACVMRANLVLGILPLGSGNGLARSLGLPMRTDLALKQLLAWRVVSIDSAAVNGQPFFCTAGVGFDAHIGGLFAQSTRRGLQSYVKLVLRELLRYRPQNYVLETDGVQSTLPAFLITIANAGQYGNDFYIAPQASMQDGLLHIVLIKPFSLIKAPGIVRRLLGKQAHLSEGIVTTTAKKVLIKNENKNMIHFDGEPKEGDATLVFEILPGSLKVLAGAGFKDG